MARDRVDDVFDEFNDLVDMSPTELDAWEDSDNRDAYAEVKSGGEPIDEPLDDIQRLKSTPKDEWRDADDGFNEVQEAEQAVSFISRMRAVEEGDDIPGTDPGISKREASLLNWGHDPNPDRSDFTGDRQR